MDKEFLNSITHLKKGDTILYPTDTVWGIGCDATSAEAVKKIYKVKERNESKSLIILVNSLEMLRTIISEIPQAALDILKENTTPTTIIYNKPKGLARNVVASDNSVAIRISQDTFCTELINKFGKPIVSTSANISDRPTPTCFAEIEPKILQNVDYVVALHHDKKNTKSSQIIKIMKDGSLKILRK